MHKNLSFPALFLALLLIAGCAPVHTPANDRDDSAASQHASADESATIDATTLAGMDSGFLFLAAQNALREGNLSLATQFLTALCDRDDAAIDPRLQLIELLLQQGRVEEAEKQVNSLLANPSLQQQQRDRLIVLHAHLQLARNHIPEALAELGRFLARQPANIEARDLQVRALSSQRRYTEALVAIEQAIKAEDKTEFRLLQAQVRVANGHDNLAAQSLERLLELDPDNENGVLMLSSLYLKLKQPESAETLLRQFIDRQANALRATNALGKLLIQQEKLGQAIEIYQDMATRTGGNPEVLQTLGMLYFRTQAFADAEQVFRKLHGMTPNDRNRFYLASALEAEDKRDEAMTLYQQIQAGSQLYVDAQIRIAVIDYSADRLKPAAKRLKALLLNDPDNTEVHLTLAAVRIAQKQYQTLLDETDALMSMAKIHPQILFNRAVAFEHFKRYEEVESSLKRLLADYPDHSESLNFLGYTYAEQNIKLDEAETLIRHALKIKKDDGYYLDSLAWIHYKRGEFAKARKIQQRALKTTTDDAVMYDHYGDILWQSGDPSAARSAWQKSLELKVPDPEKVKAKISKGLP